jgi:hypothetical protein
VTRGQLVCALAAQRMRQDHLPMSPRQRRGTCSCVRLPCSGSQKGAGETPLYALHTCRKPGKVQIARHWQLGKSAPPQGPRNAAAGRGGGAAARARARASSWLAKRSSRQSRSCAARAVSTPSGQAATTWRTPPHASGGTCTMRLPRAAPRRHGCGGACSEAGATASKRAALTVRGSATDAGLAIAPCFACDPVL